MLRVALAFCLSLLLARVATAQVPRVEDAELAFEQAVQAFEEGDYGMAFNRFRLVYDSYALNQKTTAAHLMAGKALYRNGDYAEAIAHLTAFIRRFPTSSYVGEAQHTLDLAYDRAEATGRPPEIVTLGIILPLGGDDTALTQALFNGIRLAVDTHNEANPDGMRVRMVFRDTRKSEATAAEAVRELAGAGARVIVGPLYSPEARAAGAAAERAGVVLVAPLATDEDVSEDHRFVFQANPTIMVRGQVMARYAMETLGLDRLGAVAERDAGSVSERMGEGFQREVVLQGGDLAFLELLDSPRGWAQLDHLVGPDTLARVEAIYLPVSSGRAASLIDGALQSLDRAGASVRVLGNDEWSDYRNRQLASKYQATYGSDFFVDTGRAEVQDFLARYRALAGSLPEAGTVRSRLAYTGYDLARYLLEHLSASPDRPLAEALRAAPFYQGLGIRIDFRDGNVNQALYLHRHRDGQVELVR